MKNFLKASKITVQEPVRMDWLSYELTEDDFLLGKTSSFSPELWEDVE